MPVAGMINQFRLCGKPSAKEKCQPYFEKTISEYGYGVSISSSRYSLEIWQLPLYSERAGQDFDHHLMEADA